MNNKIQRITVEVPHRISGFFEIVDQENGKKLDNPEKIGSRGAGFNLSALGKTEIHLENSSDSVDGSCSISINNDVINEKAETTMYIFNYIKKLIKKPLNVLIAHNFELPVGCGYGASGSGALGIVYGLNSILNLQLSAWEMGRIAHIAEVINRTGLGTVCGQLAGGVVMLNEPGYPCNFEHISYPNDLNVICGSFGMIATKSILSDPSLSLKIKKAGQIALNILKKDPNINSFMRASINFVYQTELLSILNLHKTKELMEELNKLDIIGASMNQLGRSVYAICTNKKKDQVKDIFRSFLDEKEIHDLTINQNGPKIIKN